MNSVCSLKEAKSHMRNEHKMEGYILCCNRQFRQRVRLIEHVKTVHLGQKHSCNLCNREFESRSYLVKHMAVHSELKNYVRI